MTADAAFTPERLNDVYRDVLALMTAALDDDDDGKTAVLNAWRGRDALPLLGAAIGRLLGLAAEHHDVREWIERERQETLASP